MLLCWIHFSDSSLDQSYAMIRTLTGQEKSIRNMSVCQSCDSYSDSPHDIQFIPVIAIKSVAYVLPSIIIHDSDRMHYGKYFDSSSEKNHNL